MKVKRVLSICFCTLAVSCWVFFSCSTPSSNQSNSLGVDITQISRYTSCPDDSIRFIVSFADSIISHEGPFTLEHLNLFDEESNAHSDSLFHDVIPTIVQIYSTYDAITSLPINEVDAAFAWHEIAKKQIAACKGKQDFDENDADSLFMVINEILEPYSWGTQYDMNMSQWRMVMMADFRLISSCKELYEACNDETLLPSVRQSYLEVMDTYRKFCSNIEERYSDLPRELASMFEDMINRKRGVIEGLCKKVRTSGLTAEQVACELDRQKNSNVEWNNKRY